MKAAAATGAALVVVGESAVTARTWQAAGGRPRLPAFFPSALPAARTAMVSVPLAALAALTRPGAKATLVVPFTLEQARTTNAVGYLPGRDPAARLLLLSAHLDHLGVGLDGQVWPGANDDASGVAALLEIAHALATGKRPRRGVLFVAYGSEEAGGFGARVPRLAAGRLQLTGFERSDLGPLLKAHGALVDADPYPEQNYFRRSDNYALALRGVVAHTVSGDGATATYHTPDDTPARLDLSFMLDAVRSLIGPIRWLADSRRDPRWKAGQQPTE